MTLTEHYLDTPHIHPIDIVEDLAEHRDWEFDRVGEDQIAMAVEGRWQTYSLTLAWSGADETLRLLCTFQMEPPEDRLAALHAVLNACNDESWTGAFTFWKDSGLIVWRYGLVLSGGQVAGAEQIDRMVSSALSMVERFYPALQLAVWGERDTKEAMQVAIAEAYGRA